MRIDKDLKLVLDRQNQDGVPYHVFASSLPKLAVQSFSDVIARAIGRIYGNSAFGPPGAAPFAADAVRQIAKEMGIEREVESNFIGEIRRLAMIVLPNGASWEPVPIDEAVKREFISEDEAEEIESLLVFFILARRVHPVSERLTIIRAAIGFHCTARTTSSPYSEWASSLTPWTKDAASGKTTMAASPQSNAQTPAGGVKVVSGPQVPS